MKKITISDESYRKLMEIKVKLRCRTWKETINKFYELVLNLTHKTNRYLRAHSIRNIKVRLSGPLKREVVDMTGK